MTSNSLTGAIPATLARLTNLRELALGGARTGLLCALLLGLAVSGGCDSSPTGPSSAFGRATEPTAGGGAPLVTWLGNAAECGSASSTNAAGEVVPARARIDSDSRGRFVEAPEVYNVCAAPVVWSDTTVEQYTTADRVGTPTRSVTLSEGARVGGQSMQDGGCGGCGCGFAGIRYYEDQIGPISADLAPQVFAFRFTFNSDKPIVVNPNEC